MEDFLSHLHWPLI